MQAQCHHRREIASCGAGPESPHWKMASKRASERALQAQGEMDLGVRHKLDPSDEALRALAARLPQSQMWWAYADA